MIPAKVEVPDAPNEVAVTPCANVLVAVVPVATMYPVWMPRVWMPPWKVDVAVVVDKSEPTVTCVPVAAREEPSNQTRDLWKAVWFVPPLATESVPATTSPFEEAESAPVLPVSFNPPVRIWRPLRVEVPVAPNAVAETPCEKVEDAVVLVALMYPVSIANTWMPLLKNVEVAVEVEISSLSMSAVDEAKREYGALVTASWRAVEVAETDCA